MNFKLMDQRRKFILGLVAGFSILAIGRWGTKKFESQFLVDYSVLDPNKKSEISSRFNQDGLQHLLAKNLDSRWMNNYVQVREHYLQEGLLLETIKEIHPDTQLIIFKNSWKSKSAFKQFCRDVKMNQLLSEFESESVNMKLKIG